MDATMLEVYPTPTTAPRPEHDANLITSYTDMGSFRMGLKPRFKVTYTAGWSVIPDNLNFLVTRLTYWRHKQRSAIFEKTAAPALGQLIIPASLPTDLKSDLAIWKRWQ